MREGVEKRMFSWRKHGMETFYIIWHAMCDVLPSISTINQWYGEDSMWPLCASPSNHKYIDCLRDNLSHGRFLWQHNQVPKCRAATLETKQKKTNNLPPFSILLCKIGFLRRFKTSQSPNNSRHRRAQRSMWLEEWVANLNQDFAFHLRLPQQISDQTSCSGPTYVIELTVPC